MRGTVKKDCGDYVESEPIGLFNPHQLQLESGTNWGLIVQFQYLWTPFFIICWQRCTNCPYKNVFSLKDSGVGIIKSKDPKEPNENSSGFYTGYYKR